MTKPCPKCRTATERDGEICIILIHVIIKYFGFKFQSTYFEVCIYLISLHYTKWKITAVILKFYPKQDQVKEALMISISIVYIYWTACKAVGWGLGDDVAGQSRRHVLYCTDVCHVVFDVVWWLYAGLFHRYTVRLPLQWERSSKRNCI